MTTHSSILAGRIPRTAGYRPQGHTESDSTERLRTASSGLGRHFFQALLPRVPEPGQIQGLGQRSGL